MDSYITSSELPYQAIKNHKHFTWARTFHSTPELYFQPSSLSEIQKIIDFARRCRRRITVIGSGHSPSDLTCTSSWLINLDKFNKILSIDKENGVVVMQSGIRLWQLGEELDKEGLAMPSLGSIDAQSIAGAIATALHGSTLYHSILPDSILSFKITLADGKTVTCSPTQNEDLFRAALVSLGALGIITEVTFQAIPSFTLAWKQVIDTDMSMLKHWNTTLWTQAEFVRVWWFPYTRRATIWTASKTKEPERDPPSSWYGGWLGYVVYHNLLYLAQWFPWILPFVEWFVFGMQYGFKPGSTTSAIQPSRKALLMDCLYSQTVNEWAIPLSKGPEALLRLNTWLNDLPPTHPDYLDPKIPFSSKGLYVHSPVEVRVTDTTTSSATRPYLDPTSQSEATLYLNATLYRPYGADPPCRQRYYEAFEWLMMDLGGRPHWAKNFLVEGKEVEGMYGERLKEWRRVRREVDPEGMWCGEWHRRVVLGVGERGLLEEREVERKGHKRGGIEVRGVIVGDEGKAGVENEGNGSVGNGNV